MLTKDTVQDHCSSQSYSILKYFLDPLSRLKKEEFRKIVHIKHNIAAEELSQQNEEKVNRAIDEGYKKYLDMCELADEDGINFYITNNDTQSPFYNKHSEKAYIGQLYWHNKQVNCTIDEIEGVIQILRNEDLHEYDINIPSFGISSSPGDYYSQDIRDIVINNNSQLTGQISCSNSVTAKELINRNANINQYGHIIWKQSNYFGYKQGLVSH